MRSSQSKGTCPFSMVVTKGLAGKRPFAHLSKVASWSGVARSERLASSTSAASIWSWTSSRSRSSWNRAGSSRHTTERTSIDSQMPSRSRVSRIPDKAASPVGSISNRSGFRCSNNTRETSNINPALQQMQPPAISRISTPLG